MPVQKKHESAATPAQANLPAEPRVLASEQLLDGGREVLIRHADDLYRLIVTKNDKLLLQK